MNFFFKLYLCLLVSVCITMIVAQGGRRDDPQGWSCRQLWANQYGCGCECGVLTPGGSDHLSSPGLDF